MPSALVHAFPATRLLPNLRAWHCGNSAQQSHTRQSCGCSRGRRQFVVQAREDGVSYRTFVQDRSIECISPTTLCSQEFGARDPTAGEIGSGFGNKPLGNYDTSHVIR